MIPYVYQEKGLVRTRVPKTEFWLADTRNVKISKPGIGWLLIIPTNM